MKCPYCGKESEKEVIFCPKCGGRIRIDTQTKPMAAHKRKNSLTIVVLVMAVILLALIAWLGWFWFADQENEQTASESGFEAYYQTVSDDDVVFENGLCYVDSQLLLTAADGVTKNQVEELVNKQGGSIVGYISISNDYQIEFADGKTYEELNEIIADWEDDESVEAVSLSYAIQISSDSIDYTNDPWIDADNASDTSGSEWSETTPEGNNWWAEAIMMPSVWEMDVEFQTVKVGIYDTMFDTDNEDLENAFVQIWNNPEDEDGNCTVKTLYSSAEQATGMYTHGTHVAGLIAAEAENGVGIAGVSQNALLYGFSYMTDPVETEDVSCWGSLFENKYSIALMLNEGVKVINLSISKEELLVAAQNGVDKALTALEEWSSSYERFLKKCLEARYDFLIVKASGNENAHNWTSCEVSEEHPYGYMQDDTAEDDMVYDAQYDFLGAIEDETVKNHILIVGAAENHTDYYTIASFSTVGERVDVYAPGVNVLSDLPINDSGVITGMSSGTSMATAIVSGIAALVWGANPDLSAVQVADIIRASATSGLNSEDVLDTEEGTPIVNAYFAVQLALATTGEGDEAECSVGILTGMTYITEEDDSVSALSDVTVTVADTNGNTVETVDTSKRSGYTFILPSGTYTITAEADGYETVSKELTLAENDVLNVDFEMQKLGLEWTDYYAEILDLFYYNITTGWEDYEITSLYGSIDDVSYMFPLFYAEVSYIDSIGYTLMDLDGNGVPELIIGIDDNGENEYTDGSVIYDLYTYVQGEIVHLATSGERYRYKLCEDNTIYYSGSAGAAYALYGHYSLNEGEDALSMLECVWSEPDDNGENMYWYYSTSEFYGSDEEEISEDEAYEISGSWPQTVKLELTPFNSYIPKSIKQNGTDDGESGTEPDISGYTDLTDYLDSIDKMYAAIGGRSSTEVGDHEKWYICDGLQYGNYIGSTKVDEIYIDGDSYLLYSIYCNMNIEEAKEQLLNDGWICTSDSNSYCAFEKDAANFWLRATDNQISSYGFWRDMESG